MAHRSIQSLDGHILFLFLCMRREQRKCGINGTAKPAHFSSSLNTDSISQQCGVYELTMTIAVSMVTHTHTHRGAHIHTSATCMYARMSVRVEHFQRRNGSGVLITH